MKAELEKLYEHIDDIEIAMMTTRRPDGHLQSRAMATQKHADGADLWFVTLEGGQKLRDIAADPHINLSYYKDRTREWVSVSGFASITRDRQKSTSCMLLTGRYGFRRKATLDTGRQTTRAWFSSVWTCTRRRSSKSISRSL